MKLLWRLNGNDYIEFPENKFRMDISNTLLKQALINSIKKEREKVISKLQANGIEKKVTSLIVDISEFFPQFILDCDSTDITWNSKIKEAIRDLNKE